MSDTPKESFGQQAMPQRTEVGNQNNLTIDPEEDHGKYSGEHYKFYKRTDVMKIFRSFCII